MVFLIRGQRFRENKPRPVRADFFSFFYWYTYPQFNGKYYSTWCFNRKTKQKTVRADEPRVFLIRWKLLAKSSIFKCSQFLTKINIMVVALKEEKIIWTDWSDFFFSFQWANSCSYCFFVSNKINILNITIRRKTKTKMNRLMGLDCSNHFSFLLINMVI